MLTLSGQRYPSVMWPLANTGIWILCVSSEKWKNLHLAWEKSPSNVSVCALTCVSVVIRNLPLFLKVMGHLQSITGIALENIAEFSYAILTHSVGASTPGQQQPVPPHLVARPPRAAASSNTWGRRNLPNINSLLSLHPSLPLFTFILRVQKFQASSELSFVIQLHSYFSASEKELRWITMSFLSYHTEYVKELGEDRGSVKLVYFCLTSYLWLFFNCSFY